MNDIHISLTISIEVASPPRRSVSICSPRMLTAPIRYSAPERDYVDEFFPREEVRKRRASNPALLEVIDVESVIPENSNPRSRSVIACNEAEQGIPWHARLRSWANEAGDMLWDKEDPVINVAVMGVICVSLFLFTLMLKSACTDARDKAIRRGDTQVIVEGNPPEAPDDRRGP